VVTVRFRISSRFSGVLCSHRPGLSSTSSKYVWTTAAAAVLLAAVLHAGALSQAAAPPLPDNTAPPPAGGKTVPLNKNGEINLIRGLSSEVAVAKIALPRGKHGIYLDSMGKVDQGKARDELKQNGIAINPGSPVKITKIVFHENHLLFEINGGGKSGTHWYQHIEVGMGTTTAPVAPVDPNQMMANGSYITLRFPDRVPNLTVDQAKLLLAYALDFSRHSPTVLYSPAVAPQVKQAIKDHKVLVGMDRDAVLSAKGPPDRKVREDQPDGTQKEDWIYGLPPHVLFVTFDGDSVVNVRQY
jgi:hypothetical protein